MMTWNLKKKKKKKPLKQWTDDSRQGGGGEGGGEGGWGEEEEEEEASVRSCELSALRNISALAHIPIREPDPALSLCRRGFPRLLKQQLLFTFPSNVNHRRRRHMPSLLLLCSPPLSSLSPLPPSRARRPPGSPAAKPPTTALIKHPGTCSTFTTATHDSMPNTFVPQT